jgi:hypothetical protein
MTRHLRKRLFRQNAQLTAEVALLTSKRNKFRNVLEIIYSVGFSLPEHAKEMIRKVLE